MNDLDGILRELKQFGTYQVLVYILLLFPIALNAAATVTYVFTTDGTGYRCFIPECELNGSQKYEQSWIRNAIPLENIHNCLRYKANSSNTTCSKNMFSSETEECDRFVFENDESTIIKDFNLFCQRNAWKRTLVGTLNSFAMLIALPIPGLISDRFGRKIMFTCSLTLSAIFGTLRSFSATYPQFVILEMLDAMSYSGVFSCLYIYGVEIVGPDMRAIGGAIINIYYSFGEILLGMVVWFFPDWRIYLRIIYIPTFIVVIYSWFLPESIRWLIAHKNKKEVTKTIEKIARWNGKTISEDIKKTIENLCSDNIIEASDQRRPNDEGKTKSPLKKVFQSKIILLRVLICSFCWITHRFVYYGLSLNTVSIAGNKYLNFIVVSFVEIPGYLLSIFMVNYYGRKLSLCLGLGFSGAACVIFHFTKEVSPLASFVLYVIGKMAITESFAALYVLASEMYPTDLRNSLIGFCSITGRLGSMLAPQIPLLAEYIDPILVFSAFSFSAAALALLYFPETKNCIMPDNVKDAEDLGKNKVKNITGKLDFSPYKRNIFSPFLFVMKLIIRHVTKLLLLLH